MLVFGASGCEMRIHDCVAAGAGAPDGVVQADPREAWIAHYQCARARDRAPRARSTRARARILGISEKRETSAPPPPGFRYKSHADVRRKMARGFAVSMGSHWGKPPPFFNYHVDLR